MGIIDKLKEFFESKSKRNQLYLPANEVFNDDVEDIKQTYRVKLPKKEKEPTLEACIEEFIKQYSLQEEINSNSSNKSYNAFRRMYCSHVEDVRSK